jgi:hypothetical protein
MKKKRGRTINIKINFSNRWLYFLITLGILAIVGVGVWAVSYSPSGAGHPYTEISTCAENQILKMNNGEWTCDTDSTQMSCRVSSRSTSTVGNYAACASDEFLTGGGGRCANGYLLYSYPAYIGSTTPDQWIVGCNSGATQNSAYAICCKY